jgi:hemoglobin
MVVFKVSRAISVICLVVALVLAVLAHRGNAGETLFAELGGATTVKSFVDGAIDRSVADPRIASSFDNVNLTRLKSRLYDQICQLADGPCVYKGRTMAASHKALKIDQAKFNALVENLQDAMDANKVPFATQNRLLALLAPMASDVVTR